MATVSATPKAAKTPKTTKTEHPHVVKTPGIVGGRPRIKDTRISVDFLARFIIGGTQPEEIAEMYPHLTLGGIYDAISYYYDHQAEIDQIIAEGEALWKRIVAATDEHGRIDIARLAAEDELRTASADVT